MSSPAVLSLGSNVGDRLGWLALGLRVLKPFAVSPVYETTAVGALSQGDFLNLVALADLDAFEAWRRAQEAERQAGRERTVPHGPRTLDVDIITAVGGAPGLVLPHPRAHERAFVLAPWCDLDATAELPGHGSVAALLRSLSTAGVCRRDDLRATP